MTHTQTWESTLDNAIKRLAQKLVEENPRLKPITGDDFRHMDSVFWRYRQFMQWHAAACTGMKRILTRNPAIKTAGVGWLKGQICLAINADFFFSLSLIQQIFVLSHETEHVIRMHITTMKQWPHMQKKLNYVMDALVNSSLVVNYDHFKVQPGKPDPLPGGDPITWERWQAMVGNQPKDPALRGVKWPTSTSIDSFIHNFTAEQLIKYLPRGNDNDEDSSDDSGLHGIESAVEKLHGDGGEFFDDESTPDDMKTAIIRNMIEEAQKSVGRGPGYLESYCDRIMDKKNRNWRMALRGIGCSTKIDLSQSWSKINKRMPWRKPGKYIFTRPPVLLVIDRSGSVGTNETTCFIMEANGIIQWVDMDVIFVDDGWDPKNPDTFIRGIDKLEPWKWWKDMGGGTHFKDVYDWLLTGEGKGKYETIIFLTDGYLADHPRIPGRLARHNIAILTPKYDDTYYQEAKALGFQVVVIDDAQRQKAQEIREQMV